MPAYETLRDHLGITDSGIGYLPVSRNGGKPLLWQTRELYDGGKITSVPQLLRVLSGCSSQSSLTGVVNESFLNDDICESVLRKFYENNHFAYMVARGETGYLDHTGKYDNDGIHIANHPLKSLSRYNMKRNYEYTSKSFLNVTLNLAGFLFGIKFVDINKELRTDADIADKVFTALGELFPDIEINVSNDFREKYTTRRKRKHDVIDSAVDNASISTGEGVTFRRDGEALTESDILAEINELEELLEDARKK